MANPTSLVKETTTPFTTTTRRWGLAATAQTYYPGEMIGMNTSGYCTKLDDTAALLFVGVNAESVDKVVESTDSAGDKTLDVKREFLMTMAMSSVTIADIGKKVFAAYSNQVQFGDGTYGNYVGKVFGVVNSTTALIAPHWSPLCDMGGSYQSVKAANAAAATTLTKHDLNKIISVPNTAAVTINLPAVADCSPGDRLLFIKTSSDAFAFTLDGNSGETINGSATLASSTSQYETVEIVTDGAAWYATERGGSFGASVMTAALRFDDDIPAEFGSSSDAQLLFSTADADSHTTVLALDNTNQSLHVTDVGAKATDWGIAAGTHPTIYIHSNTTPTTDYMSIGTHDGTVGTINVAGGNLALQIAGNTEATLSAATLTLGDASDSVSNMLVVYDGGGEKPGLLKLYASNGTPYYLWVDSTGDLRIHNDVPADEDMDGSVVGGQS